MLLYVGLEWIPSLHNLTLLVYEVVSTVFKIVNLSYDYICYHLIASERKVASECFDAQIRGSSRKETLGKVKYGPRINLLHDPLQLLGVRRVVPGMGLLPIQLRVDVVRVAHEAAPWHLWRGYVSSGL